MKVQVSPNFKKMTRKAIFAIVLFIIVYLILSALAVLLTTICILGGIALIITKPIVITIGLGIGLASLGVFIFIFLFKFLFKKHAIQREHLIEITQNEEPLLFEYIEKIVQEVETDFPKKIYLSSDVNACVFYDSSFWSMIFPIRKNLQIGLGLVNTITEQEFKAILAHEFGHFSQRSMKVGSYVYNVNQIIFNMLYDNDSYDKMIHRWANISGYFAMFVIIAKKIVQGIQWILKKMYALVNISYMALSREMEFHADEIAANVAGSAPLQESLLRLNLANVSYNSVLNFYDGKIEDNIKSKNLYEEQTFVMNMLAEENKLSIKNNLPVVTLLESNKYNKTKLNIKDQWASHPSVEERILALEKLNISKDENKSSPAILLFSNKEKIQARLTDKIFSEVIYQKSVTVLELEAFKKDYMLAYHKNCFPSEYNGYYDSKNPIRFDFDLISIVEEVDSIENLFSKEKVDLVYDLLSMENDKIILTNIANKEYNVKSFDYDGQKYSAKEVKVVLKRLEDEMQIVRKIIEKNDIDIFKFFHNKAVSNGRSTELKEKYRFFFDQDTYYDEKLEQNSKLANSLSFVSEVTAIEKISRNFQSIAIMEMELKKDILHLMSNPDLVKELSQLSKANFENYLSHDWVYFSDNAYLNENLQILYTAVNDFNFLLSRNYFLIKKDLLNYQIKLLGDSASA